MKSLFPSSFLFTVSLSFIIAKANSMSESLLSEFPQGVSDAIQYERSLWAHSAEEDAAFYSVSGIDMASAQPGTPIKVQEDANVPQNYTLPPNTAVSRFIYVSESLSGERRPVSGYVLWPYMPRLDANGGNQVVAWAHGTSGTTVSTAPSKFKNLWNHFIAPYQLVLQGYVVVATDYAGLGVGKDQNNHSIAHDFFASSSVATDVVYSVQAAKKAFPQLSESFVVLGHSQGGGATWGVAQKHAVSKIPGYLGAIAISPATSVLDNPEPFGSLIAATMAPGIAALYPEFDYNDFFTPDGLELFQKIVKLDCASSTTIPILLTLAGNLLKPDWTSNEWLLKYDNLTANGGRKISGPLLVIQGDNDPMVNYNNTVKKLGAALDLSPTSHVQLFRLPGTSHTPAVTGSQRIWMDWIADRFAGVQLQSFDKNASFTSVVTPARNLSSYVPELNWFVGPATEPYQTP